MVYYNIHPANTSSTENTSTLEQVVLFFHLVFADRTTTTCDIKAADDPNYLGLHMKISRLMKAKGKTEYLHAMCICKVSTSYLV